MVKGPTLKFTRYYHGCGTFKHLNQIIIMVGGGSRSDGRLSSTELWNPKNGIGWTKGEILVFKKMILKRGLSFPSLWGRIPVATPKLKIQTNFFL